MRFSDVHKVRAQACRALARELLAPYEQREVGRAPSEVLIAREAAERLDEVMHVQGTGVEVCALVTTPAAARVARTAGAARIYATTDALRTSSWEDVPEVIPWLDEVCREVDHERLDPWVCEGQPVAVGSVSELALASERGAFAEVRPCIPVHNPSAMAALAASGARGFWLSPEMTLAEATQLAAVSPLPVGIVAHGRVRTMTSEHCVLQAADRCVHDCARCELRQQDTALVGEGERRFPVRTDLQGRSRIYSADPIDAAPEVAELIAGGVTRLLVDGTLLAEQELVRAVRRLVGAAAAAQEGRPMPERLAGHTAGHLHRGIE